MKNLWIQLVISISFLNAFGLPIRPPIDPVSCLEVGTVSGQSCSGNIISVDDIDSEFTTIMRVGDVNLKVLDIPIYVDTNSNDEVSMTVTDKTDLENSDGEKIDFSMQYIQNGSVVTTISSGVAFTLLEEGASGRDGDTVVGYIRIVIASLLDTQTVGKYSFSKDIKVGLGDIRESSSADFDAQGEVEQVTVIGFESLSSFKDGLFFLDALVDYGNFRLNQNNEKREDVFVKNNTKGDIKIKFDTSPLTHTIDENYQIEMSYYYQESGEVEKRVDNNTFFTLISGKNGGDKVGEMRFVTEPLTQTLMAGEYSAVLNITVSAN